MRYSEFSDKHYYNVRNRLFVAKKYTRVRIISTTVCIIIALFIWLLSEKKTKRNSIRLFLLAIKDGVKNKLGMLSIRD